MSGLKTNIAISAIALSFAVGAHANPQATTPEASTTATVIFANNQAADLEVDPMTDAEGEVQTETGAEALEYWIDGNSEEIAEELDDKTELGDETELEENSDELPPPQIPATMTERRDTTTGPTEEEPASSDAYRETQAQYLEEVLRDNQVSAEPEAYEDLVDDSTAGDDELIDDDYDVDVTDDLNEDEDIVDPKVG